MNNTFVYPAKPTDVSPAIMQPSPSFKKEVKNVLGAIIFFFVVYILLFLLAIVLVIGCFYGGVGIITHAGHLLIILAGLGLISVGIMVFVFLVKFLFSVSKYDRSGIVEITAVDQPILFAFIRQLTIETATKFPRKIYLSPDVNAAVFYDSSFWSMFFPVQKNLQIGLGLVNSLNVSEFKAVMAHEFGHFSQRSMKLGSFVYHVNKIIHNMLFDNKGYAKFLQAWANIHGVFALFAGVTAKIAEAIQWVLKQMYANINKSYMRLSREMEFHADAVAASVSGSKSLVTALRRVELADSGYRLTLQKCDELYRQQKKSQNIYENQSAVMLQLARDYHLPLEYNLSVVSDEFLKGNNLSRINFKDQWASHPSTEDREFHLNQLAVEAEIISEPAWVLFRDKEAVQQQLTTLIFAATSDAAIQPISNDEFVNQLKADVDSYTLPEIYHGFYDNRQPNIPENFPTIIPEAQPHKTIETIFTADHALLPKKIGAAINDLELLKAIQDKRIQTKTFDFDGLKYNQQDAGTIMVQVENDLKIMQAKLDQLDQEAILYFMKIARQNGEAEYLEKRYTDYFLLRKQADEFLQQVNQLLSAMQPIFSGSTIPIESIQSMILNLKQTDEPLFKKNLQLWLSKGVFAVNPALTKSIDDFCKSDYAYFADSSFFEGELTTLHSLSSESWNAISHFLFITFKDILVRQLTWLPQ